MDPNSVILFTNSLSESSTYSAPYHQFSPITEIREVHVGSNVAMYGSAMKKVDGVVIPEYIHLRGGAYTFKIPFQLNTFHVSTVV
jgi:hypothetical protein